MSRSAPCIPASVGYAVLRHFHAAAAMTMVATASLRQELGARGFRKLGSWTRGVDTDLFSPDHPAELDLPRPIFMTMGRVAVEKNLEAFLSLDLPGTKVVIGDGPQKAELAQQISGRRYSSARRKAQDLTAHLAAADVFVFPEPHRHVRRRAARSAGLRHAGRGVSGHRPDRRDRRPSDRRAG